MAEDIRLWLDDVRDPRHEGRSGWTWAKNYAAAISVLKTGLVVEASLDHDLGGPFGYGSQKSGYDVVCWMEENDVWPEEGVRVHSMNPVGAKRMRRVIDRAYSTTDPTTTSTARGGGDG